MRAYCKDLNPKLYTPHIALGRDAYRGCIDALPQGSRIKSSMEHEVEVCLYGTT